MATNRTAAEFTAWLEAALMPSPPSRIVAYNVNLYYSPFRADLVGSTFYDADDSDWACEEAWTSKNRRFDFPHDLAEQPWQDRLAYVGSLLQTFLSTDSPAARLLKNAEALAYGFVDGDLQVAHIKA